MLKRKTLPKLFAVQVWLEKCDLVNVRLTLLPSITKHDTKFMNEKKKLFVHMETMNVIKIARQQALFVRTRNRR